MRPTEELFEATIRKKKIEPSKVNPYIEENL